LRWFIADIECIFESFDKPCQRCESFGLPCSEKRRPGANRLLQHLKLTVRGQIPNAGPHEFEVMTNKRWETYHTPWLSNTVQHYIFDFTQALLAGVTSDKVRMYQELERYIRQLIFYDSRWRPGTDTSLMVTLTSIGGMRHRFWVNGHLIGMIDALRYKCVKGLEGLQEACVMVEHVARFPDMKSLEAYVQSRLPYEHMTQNEVQCIATQIEHRFRVIGRTEVREFELRRKLRRNKTEGRKLIVISLQWDMNGGEGWGYSSWKAYFREDYDATVKFLTSRISCHIDFQNWKKHKFPSPRRFWRLPSKSPPSTHEQWSTAALSWLQYCFDHTLRKVGIIFSVEDDPNSGLPEDFPEEVNVELIKKGFRLHPPEKDVCSFPVETT
jgi:hypothetical protein